MSFADQVRKIHIPGKDVSLSQIEKTGDPEALAISFSDFKTERETQAVAQPRASSLYDACMRKHVIGTIQGLDEPQWISIRTKIVYGIGNAIHDLIQNTGILFGDRRYGWWFCGACRRVRYFGAPPKKPCEKCKAHQDATVYREHYLNLKKPLFVTGHPDMFFRPVHIKRLRIVELKTIEGDEFDKLRSPLAAHEWQLHTYLWAISFDKTIPMEVDISVGYIVYVTKRTRKEIFPVKIFPIISNTDLLKRIKAKLTLYKDGLIVYPKNLPGPVEDCVRSRFEGYRAKQCVALKECKKYAINGAAGTHC